MVSVSSFFCLPVVVVGVKGLSRYSLRFPGRSTGSRHWALSGLEIEGNYWFFLELALHLHFNIEKGHFGIKYVFLPCPDQSCFLGHQGNGGEVPDFTCRSLDTFGRREVLA